MNNLSKKYITLFFSAFFLISFTIYIIFTNYLRNNVQSQIESSLPVLEIYTEEYLPLVDKEFSNATATYFSDENKVVFLDKILEIRYRGNSTYDMEKKPYKIVFPSNTNLLDDFDNAGRSWVLLADYADKSLMRNYTALSLAKVFDGFEFTTDFQFVELVLNENHLGTFLLCEQIEVSKSVIDIDERAGDILFERVTEDRAKQDYNFSIEGLWRNVIYDIRSDVSYDSQITNAKNITELVNQSILENNQANIVKYLDLNSTIDYYILHELMKNIDVGFGSCYTYVRASENKLYFSTPWDFDLSAGNNGLYLSEYDGLYVGDISYQLPNAHDWFQLLMQYEWFQEMVTHRLSELKPNIEMVFQEVLQASNLFEFEFERNLEIWNLNEISRNENFDIYFEWINNRYDWLCKYFDDLDF